MPARLRSRPEEVTQPEPADTPGRLLPCEALRARGGHGRVTLQGPGPPEGSWIGEDSGLRDSPSRWEAGTQVKHLQILESETGIRVQLGSSLGKSLHCSEPQFPHP